MKILGVGKWPDEADLGLTLENPSGLKPPPSKWQLIRCAIGPALIMVALRPILVILLVVLVGLGWGLWHHLFLHFHH